MMMWLLNIEINQGADPFKNIFKINGNKHDYIELISGNISKPSQTVSFF
jgi:hypothetical protein